MINFVLFLWVKNLHQAFPAMFFVMEYEMIWRPIMIDF